MRHSPGRLARSWAAALLVAGAAVPAASRARALASVSKPMTAAAIARLSLR